ncbi:TolC family protein [Rhodoferax sp.]|uniref:TolC family protein n=1 Tax=Rhodoferax sp. TaxID=50421 RepID=UPI00374CE1FB
MKTPPLIFKFAALCVLAATQGASLAQPLSFDAAWLRVKTDSDKLAGANAGVQSKALQLQGLQGLGGPSVSVFATSFIYNANLAVDLGPLNQKLTQLEQGLPTSLQHLLGSLALPQLPASYSFNQHDTVTTGSLSAIWPIYAGGVSDAARGFVSAQMNEAHAEADQTEHELATLLVQRYFGAQLAIKAAQLRQAAVHAIGQHDDATEKMLVAGVLSKIERLQAMVAFEEAKRSALKAQDDAELAAAALARTVKSESAVTPVTPLFVLTQALEPLPYFLDAASQHHPALAKVAAKKTQAEQLHRGQEALRKPQVFVFGQHELKTQNADWMAGVGVRWTLFDSIDRDALAASSQKMVEQAQHMDAQARSDIALLVEKNWRAVEQGRRQFIATQAGLLLAAEVLRLRTAALRAGTGTALELIDAEVNQAKVQTERAQIAYDYVLALAHLLESCGLSEQFSSYIARADVKVN